VSSGSKQRRAKRPLLWILMENLKVENNPNEQRFEINLDGETAFVSYVRRDGGPYKLWHTEVPEKFAGHGVGSALAKGTLESIKAEGAKIISRCPFISSYLQRHPEYEELVENET
jgi:predicted GNAT family acetyltransferase